MTRQSVRILMRLYAARPCWICKSFRWCGHRQPEIDLAERGEHSNAKETTQ